MLIIFAMIAMALPLNLHAKEFTVMTYNVENLFDTTHDEGKKDYTNLPLEVKKKMPEAFRYCRSIQNPYWREECYTLDWNEETLNAKIRNISRVILDFDNGRGPDILVLQEVENMNVLKMLNERGNLGYSTLVLLEGEDFRGIDVAIMSRFPLMDEPELHHVETQRKVRTRGILEAKFDVYGKSVVVFANHWPSQANPDELRVLAAKKLMYASARARADIRIAAGDFNTKENDKLNGLRDIVLKPQRRIHFHPTNPSLQLRNEHAEGSHWYQGKWVYLDRILIDSKSTENGVQTEFVLHARDYMLKRRYYRSGRRHDVAPYRFDPVEDDGYSDHLPVAISVDLP